MNHSTPQRPSQRNSHLVEDRKKRKRAFSKSLKRCRDVHKEYKVNHHPNANHVNLDDNLDDNLNDGRRRRRPSRCFISPPESPAMTITMTSPSFQRCWNHQPLEESESFVITQSSDSEMDLDLDEEETSLVPTSLLSSLSSSSLSSPISPPPPPSLYRKRARLDFNYNFSMEDRTRTTLLDCNDQYQHPYQECQHDATDSKSRHHCRQEWWKQRPKLPTHVSPNTCFICHSPTPAENSDGEEDRKSCPMIHKQEVKQQTNSLLSYFVSQSPSSTRVKPLKCQPGHAVVPAQTQGRGGGRQQGRKSMSVSSSCHYCERISCQSCTLTCERCSGRFCKFCSTINYDGPMERTFCLDCQSMEGGAINDDDDDVSMG